MPQVSILCPLFFKIFINELFPSIETTSFCNYADENTMYCLDKITNNVVSRLMLDIAIILEWFYDNYMDLNAERAIS